MSKKITLLIALVVLLIVVAGVQADSTEDAILCGGLAEADCAIKKSNSEVMDELQAFAMALSMRMDIDRRIQPTTQASSWKALAAWRLIRR